MQKAITYLYPDASNAVNLKMFQDRTNQIRGYYFTRESYKQVYVLPFSSNYAIYFLFDDSEDENQVYVGQSVNGIQRIDEHIRSKDNHNAKLFIKDGNFILSAGSEIKRPPETTKDWKDKSHYGRGNAIIDNYIEDEKAREVDGKIITQVNLAFKSPSAPANLITGLSENGWKFFKGLDEIRSK